MLFEVDYENVFLVESEPAKDLSKPSAGKQARKPFTGWIRKAATLATVAAVSLISNLVALIKDVSHTAVLELAKEIKLSNGVMVYGDSKATLSLADLVAEFPTIWKDEGFVKVPIDDWMKITLRDDWQSRLPNINKAKVYSLGHKDR